jgi:hypothetical protein
VPVNQVQQQLRLALGQWGRPQILKVDNGSPWGSWSDLPPPLALWLIGLGLNPHWIPPRQPQKNGVAERSHGVTQAWAELGQCRSVAAAQERVNREDVVQREKYPHKGELSRWQVYPGLRHSGRNYDAAWEEANWSWQRVLEHLGEYAVDRRVDGSGKIGLYGGKVYLGVALRRQNVIVQFDAQERQWLICNSKGVELTRRPLTQFDHKSLRHLSTPSVKDLSTG